MCPCGSVDDEDVRFKMASNKQKNKSRERAQVDVIGTYKAEY